MIDCKKKNQPPQWDSNTIDNGIKLLINNHLDFFIKAKNKYVKIYPKSKELINNVEKNINLLTIKEMVSNTKNKY